jgi:hypothetical protein
LTDFGCTRSFADRAEVTLLCEVRQRGQPWKKVRIDDISQAGFRIAWFPEPLPGEALRIRIPGLQVLTAQIRWQQDKAVGCEFTERLHVAVFEHVVRQCH